VKGRGREVTKVDDDTFSLLVRGWKKKGGGGVGRGFFGRLRIKKGEEQVRKDGGGRKPAG